MEQGNLERNGTETERNGTSDVAFDAYLVQLKPLFAANDFH